MHVLLNQKHTHNIFLQYYISIFQEKGKNLVGSLEKGKKSARNRIERTTKQAKDEISRRVHKKFASFGRDTSMGVVHNISSPFIDDRPISMPANPNAKIAQDENPAFNPVLSSKIQDLSKIPDDVSRSYSPPPPEYPPPPLPDDSTYDVPSSASSSRFNTLSTMESSSSSYRSSFSGVASLYDEPRSTRNLTAASDAMSFRSDLDDISDCDLNDFSTFPRGKQTMRADSWSYYDASSKRSSAPSTPEPVYSNDVNEHLMDPVYGNDSVDSGSSINTTEEPLTPTAASNDSSNRFSALSHITDNSLYENCEISVPTRAEPRAMRPKHSNSLLREFDPLAVSSFVEAAAPAENDLLLLESLLEGDTYGTLGRNQVPMPTQENDIQEDYPSSDEDNTNVIYGLEPVSEDLETDPKSPVIKVTNVQHEALPELPPKLKSRDNDLSKPSTSTSRPSNTTFPLSPKINLSAAQYESLADTVSDPAGLLHASSDVLLNRSGLEEKEEKSGVSKNLGRFTNLWRRASFKSKDNAKLAECITKPILNGVHVSHKGKLYKCTDLFFGTKQVSFKISLIII